MQLWICLRRPEEDRASPPAPDALQRLALAMLQYTPQVALFRGDSVVLEVAASLALFRGPLRLSRLVQRTARALWPGIRLGMAPSATGAWLLAAPAAAAHRRVLRHHSLARNLDEIPADRLPEALPHRRWLENIGCRRLGQLRRLPRPGLQQRSSPELLKALDAAYGRVAEIPPWFTPPAVFRLTHEPDVHLENAEALLQASHTLLQALCGWLHHRQEALHGFQLVLHHEKGHHAMAPARLSLRFSTATWRQEDFTLLLKERLQHCELKNPVVQLELVADTPVARPAVCDTLFPDPSRQAQQESRLLDLLAARLGNESIRRPAPKPDHLPELANAWANYPDAATRNPLPATTGLRNRPFWLLSEPRPLETRQERPVYQGRALRLVQGPERLETGWFAGLHHRRDYFVAEDAEGARYWLYRERETGEGWFLHGLFA